MFRMSLPLELLSMDCMFGNHQLPEGTVTACARIVRIKEPCLPFSIGTDDLGVDSNSKSTTVPSSGIVPGPIPGNPSYLSLRIMDSKWHNHARGNAHPIVRRRAALLAFSAELSTPPQVLVW
jgi:hypothetical protein